MRVTEDDARSECEASARSGTGDGNRSESMAVAISDLRVVKDHGLRQCKSRN